ncbi:diacylglycerol/lipid kinase family protein [Algibacter luteus]|uniref:diacylglycerol/lipid kinase family protein n=1 Tax=Algibacter luteus TaxID=1178825 RepID=UPI00259142F0|nr:diacylglycerol kinase family protein [Algibacter luteus]WJJ97075.1 diacylglycerol kinase family lipid kinase [Algibacter luteus]
MSAAPVTWFVIINPTSGNGLSRKKWPNIKALLEKYEFNFQFEFTRYPKHSTELLHQALIQNIKHFICVGGDGTLHNMVNAIMTQNLIPTAEIKVGVIPIGTGNDWVKTHNIPKDFESCIQIIKNGQLKTQDVGEIVIRNNSNKPIFFINLAGIGFDGFVVSKVHKFKHLGAIAYLYGTIISLFRFKNFKAKVASKSETISGKTLMILIGLCQYSGGGMQLTESANPFDGLLDISVAKNLRKLEIVSNLPKLFNGNVTRHHKVKTFKTEGLTVEIDQMKEPLIQADGELVGSGSFEVIIIPKAFSFYT